MNNKKGTKFKRAIDTVFLLVMTVVFCLPLYGCYDDRVFAEDAIAIARKDFGCKSILWYASLFPMNSLTNTVYYIDGYKIYKNESLPDEGGHLVIGLDKNEKEKYIAVPEYINSRYKAFELDWRLSYTMRDILDFAGEHNFKYASGIDGIEKQFINDSSMQTMKMLGNQSSIQEDCVAFYDENFYASLDEEIVFEYTYKADENNYHYCYIMQIGGELIMYECYKDDGNIYKNRYKYATKGNNNAAYNLQI